MISALYEKAERMSAWRSACNVRCEPHPGHFNPVSARNEHFGKKRCSSGLNLKYIILPIILISTIHILKIMILGVILVCCIS
jgi:hypothetical protein